MTKDDGERQSMLTPSASLLVKLGSIAVHADELMSPDGHTFDWRAIQSLLADAEVAGWLRSMDAAALVPKKRKPHPLGEH